MNEKEIILTNLQKFLVLMCEWEKNANLELKEIGDITNEKFYSQQIEKRSKIFSELVTDKKRKKGGIDDFSIGFPEKYNPELEKIGEIEIDANKAFVFVEKEISGNVKKQRKYVFTKINNNWLLDDVYEWASYNNKWVLMAI